MILWLKKSSGNYLDVWLNQVDNYVNVLVLKNSNKNRDIDTVYSWKITSVSFID